MKLILTTKASCNCNFSFRTYHRVLVLIVDYFVKLDLKYVRIYFDATTFDKITKDRAAKFVDMLSAIGGTMGLLTGFSIISGVEIVYFAAQIILQAVKNILANKGLKMV